MLTNCSNIFKIRAIKIKIKKKIYLILRIINSYGSKSCRNSNWKICFLNIKIIFNC